MNICFFIGKIYAAELPNRIVCDDERLPIRFIADRREIERTAPIRIWQHSWEKVLSVPRGVDTDRIDMLNSHTIVLALHGLFDHKGAYQELATSLLENADSRESLIIIAADLPTHGSCEDRAGNIPPFNVMKAYLLSVLEVLSDRYPKGKFFLLGESLGASLILIARNELSDLQARKNCIGGAIVISPAIHNPRENLYLQSRPLTMSAEPGIFRRIWFNDPEVNHQNVFSRIRATIPYLSEAYQEAMLWPETLPCAVFLASQDSVVLKSPAISLYTHSPHLVCYAFPSRHLILRSQSERYRYIDRHIIFQDIYSLMRLMDHKTFNRTAQLPFSGAKSQETMEWYTMIDRSCCCSLGYFNDWIKTLRETILPPSVRRRREPKVQTSLTQRSATPYLVLLPDGRTGIEVIEGYVPGDGDCGFHVLDIDRETFATELLGAKEDDAARRRLSSEIRHTLLSNELPQHLRPSTWELMQHTFQEAWETLECEMSRIKLLIEEDYPKEIELLERIEWLISKSTPDDVDILRRLWTLYDTVNQDINRFCAQPSTFEYYVNLYRIPKTVWMGYQSALVWSKVKDISVYIWRKKDEASNTLVFIDAYNSPTSIKTIHMLHTSRFTHFNRLDVVQTRNFEEDCAQIIRWNQTTAEFPSTMTLYQLFAAQVERTPEREAVISSTQRLTYKAIFERANQIGHLLMSRSVATNELVGVLMVKGWEQVVATLGVLSSGAAFLPLDPLWPKPRIKEILDLARVRFVLTQGAFLESNVDDDAFCSYHWFAVDRDATWEVLPNIPPKSIQNSDQIAYVIFTSGSTGIPKGVIISHRGVVNTLVDINRRFHLDAESRTFALSNLTFDLSIYDIFGPLLIGGSIVLPTQEGLKEPADWVDKLTSNTVTVWNTVPMLMEMLIQYLESLPAHRRPDIAHTLRLILLSGDWIPTGLPERIQRYFPHSEIISLGGATEGSIWSILFPITAGVDPSWKSIPYGLPMMNQKMYVLDDGLNHCPFGQLGEIYIGGVGVALGYWGDAERTSENFITHPRTGERLYKTGDFGQWNAKGYIEFHGRKDTQVKIGGYRIEIGDIETCLSKHLQVTQCAVIAKGSPGAERLIAYIVPTLNELEVLEGGAIESAWTFVYEEVYRSSSAEDLSFNIAGWKSSYTGDQIPAEEMSEWVQDTIQRIQALHPQHVLEIGCGTGLLLSRIAPHCETYVATDISEEALKRIDQLQHKQAELSHVILYHTSASDFTSLEGRVFDTIILNSIVQCFPSEAYLVGVIEDAIGHLRPGGSLFIGDIRNFDLLEAHHASILAYQRPDHTLREDFSRELQHNRLRETELLVSPQFFYRLKERFPQIKRVHIHLKQGRHLNELNRFRYDVVLHIAEDTPPSIVPTAYGWKAEDTLETLLLQVHLWKLECSRDHVSRGLYIQGIPNHRLGQETAVLRWLRGKETTDTLGDIKASVASTTLGINPADLYHVAEREEILLLTNWNQDHPVEALNALFIYVPEGTIVPEIATGEEAMRRESDVFTNSPLIVKAHSILPPLLEEHCRSYLPHYMIPTSFIILPSLPLSSNGKVDRNALAAHVAEFSVEKDRKKPTTTIEHELINLWKRVLNLNTLGIEDDFFEIGGNSLAAVHVIGDINQHFKVEYPISTLFKQRTIQTLAEMIARDSRAKTYQPFLSFNESGSNLPIFFIHSGRGGAEAYLTFANYFSAEQPLYVIEPYNLYKGPPFLTSIEQMAQQYLTYVREIQPDGPYYLGGWSQGGLIAYEIAQRLTAEGNLVAGVYFLDTFTYTEFECRQFRSGVDTFLERDPFYSKLPETRREQTKMVDRIQTIAMLDYKPHPYEGNVLLLKARDAWTFLDTPDFQWNWMTRRFMHYAFSKEDNGWSKFIPYLRIQPVTGHHQSIMEGLNASRMAAIIQQDYLTLKQRLHMINGMFENYIVPGERRIKEGGVPTAVVSESIRLAAAQGSIGPRAIDGWELHDVDDRGNCFYEALAHQLQRLHHPVLTEIPATTLPRDFLRLRIQGELFRDREWAEDQQIDAFIHQFPDLILAIVDTRRPETGFVHYYMGEDREVITHVSGHGAILPDRLLVRLAATGNHFLSVVRDPSEGSRL